MNASAGSLAPGASRMSQHSKFPHSQHEVRHTQKKKKTKKRAEDLDVGGSLTSLEGRCASTFEYLVIFPKPSRRSVVDWA